jgi:hypothetical protein
MKMPREENCSVVEETEWGWLRRHLERDAVIIVAPALDLAEAAQRLAADDSGSVAAWIAAGLLCKPSAEQLAEWNAAPGQRFRMLIVQPYVLIQEPLAEPKEEAKNGG